MYTICICQKMSNSIHRICSKEIFIDKYSTFQASEWYRPIELYSVECIDYIGFQNIFFFAIYRSTQLRIYGSGGFSNSVKVHLHIFAVVVASLQNQE